jgi:hypothetical protein
VSWQGQLGRGVSGHVVIGMAKHNEVNGMVALWDELDRVDQTDEWWSCDPPWISEIQTKQEWTGEHEDIHMNCLGIWARRLMLIGKIQKSLSGLEMMLDCFVLQQPLG